MNKLHVLLAFGGESTEHEVSISSAHNVYAALDDKKYDVSLCYIDKVGRWWLVDSIRGDYVGRPQLVPRLGQRAFWVHGTDKVLRPDVLLPILHGANGEDGSVQGLSQLLHMPCVGPSVLSAAITMNKDITKRLLRDAGVPVVPWLCLEKSAPRPHFANVQAKLGGEVFVKPAASGSSVGVHKVSNGHELVTALSDAFRYDDIVLIESAIDAQEIEVGVLGNDSPIVTGLGEIVPGDTFYSYNDKYSDTSTAALSIPAEVEPSVAERIRVYALTGYRATVGHGMARIDFFIDKGSGEIYLNEINSIPGFTNISMYPKLWHAAGISYGDLIDKLIGYALEKRYNKVSNKEGI